MIFFMGLNYLFVEIYPIEFIGKLQFQRFIPFVRYLAILIFIISVLCLYRKPKKHIISTVLVLLPFSIGIFLQDDDILFYSCGFLLFFLVALFSSKLSPLPLTAIIVMISILLDSSLIALNNKYYETRNLRLNIAGEELVDGNKTANFLKENSKKAISS